MKVRLVAGVVAVLSCGVAAADEKVPIWEKAARVYKNAMSQYNAGHWTQAKGLLEEFIRKYGTHEDIPVAYLQVAHCKWMLKDPTGCMEELDTVIRRFRGSPTWFLAHGFKLRHLLAAKKHDEYLELLEKMLRLTQRMAPLRLGDDIANHRRHWWFRDTDSRVPWFRHSYHYYWGISQPFRHPGWVLDIVAVCDTLERAEKALKLLAPTLRHFEKQLPPDWQFAHVALLRKAGQAERADALFKEYADAWGKDPRAISLWLLEGYDAQSRKDGQRAKAAFDYLIKTYPGSYILRTAVPHRLLHLYNTSQYEPFAELADYYLKSYPLGQHRRTLVSQWVQLARRLAAKKDPSRIPEVMKMLDEVDIEENVDWLRRKLRWNFELYIDLKQYAEAAKIAETLLSEKHWTGSHLSYVGRFAGADKGIAKAVEDARKRYGIEPMDPKSKAGEMLKDLKTRIKDEQRRHMEEIGEEMFTQHRKDPATIQAIRLLVDSYYGKVLVNERDKWMARMIATYPRHPATEHVLDLQIRSLGAARNYPEMAKSIDLAAQRFPGRGTGYWYGQRIACYNAIKDEVGKVNYVRKVHAARIKKKDVRAIVEVARHEVSLLPEEDVKGRGDHWMNVAKGVAGTRAEVYCLYQAYVNYFVWPWHHHKYREDICWDEARQAANALAAQKLDPQLAWQITFEEVDLYTYEGQGKQAIAALGRRLKDVATYRDLARQVQLGSLGEAVGKAKLGRKGAALVRRLKAVCWTRQDLDAIDTMQGQMYRAAAQPAKAAPFYMNIVNRAQFPIAAYYTFQLGLQCLHGSSSTYPAAITAYIARIPRVQETVPGLLNQAGQHYLRLRSNTVMTYRQKLVSQYPASSARGSLETSIASVRRQEAERKKAGKN